MYDYCMKKLVYQKFILGTQDAFGSRNLFNTALADGLGGVIFFTRDITSKEQFTEFVNEIKKKANRPLFLSIDQEGGRVERTENIHARYLSPKYAYEKGEEFLRSQTLKIANELKSYGLNMNFAPCADVNTNPDNPIIGERAFANNPEDVSNGVKIVSDIYRKQGIIPCLKHFPGHGDANSDSHKTLPEINLSMDDMEKFHIRPFKENIECEMIMVAHLHCTCFDKEVIPSSLSKNVIGYLRNILNYQGVIISDDMVMNGVQGYGSIEACIMAILAGVDMFIFRDADENAINTIEEIIKRAHNNVNLKNAIIASNKRIEKLKLLI